VFIKFVEKRLIYYSSVNKDMTYYDNIASGYKELHKEEQLEKIAIIKKHVPFHAKWKVLDVGCGPYFGDFEGHVVGIDPSIKLLKQAKIPVVLGVGEALPFRSDGFMAVVCITAIQNFDDVKKGLLEMKRVAKEYIVISVLKGSAKVALLEEVIPEHLSIERIVEEEKDILFFCRKKKV
jgi:ubiquinone/menaquinone biosynthesis C-methylase UbiE